MLTLSERIALRLGSFIGIISILVTVAYFLAAKQLSFAVSSAFKF
jgi:hypothetical protein